MSVCEKSNKLVVGPPESAVSYLSPQERPRTDRYGDASECRRWRIVLRIRIRPLELPRPAAILRFRASAKLLGRPGSGRPGWQRVHMSTGREELRGC